MKKPLTYFLIALILGIVAYNSVYIKKLDDVKKEQTKATFDAKTYANDFFNSKLETVSSTAAADFLNNIKADVKGYSEENGNKLGISTDYYFIIDGNASVVEIEDEYILVTLDDDHQKMKIATDFIFGNAIREGTQMAHIGDYQNTMDYNNISVESNNIVRETILPPFIQKVKKSDSLYFKGAVRLNTKKPKFEDLRVIPLVLKIKK
ncbi:DUF2291 family protein [Maribacter polysiphoniae]|uniref:DUF2291 family protein n=1 Tax=Maribacter polysiphoniae TaxID=429344 RepID=A0A316DZ76_9FLAO|nr:DUF2291 family protein [Maribacter polysiphoniae]MBD1261385.1 DUF2291 family protein [Maribacter polysiphoniae]PWK22718.1 putative lipoprotein DUF2291 [Maribacter polysiphoniae]